MRGLATLFILASALVVTPTYSDEGSTLKGPKGVDYGEQGRSIGPIKPTDTLWRIAAKIRPDNSVSIYQVMQALYDKNPSSFLDQNLNHMRDGAYLKIPTIAEMRAVNPTLAKARSEQDDELWEKKKNGTLTTAEINESQKNVTQARKVDVDEAKQELKQEINTIKAEQGTQLVELQKQFKSSVENVEEILEENNKLKKQLTGISKELETVRDQLGQDSEIQKQLKELIAKQNEIIEQQRAKKIEEDSGFNFSSILSNPFVLGALMFLPALLIIAAVVMFLKKRNSSETDDIDDDEFLPQSPVHTPDDDLDPIVETDPLVPEPSDDDDELSVRLDDDQDMLPDDDIIFDDSIDDSFDDDDSVLNQDELNGLLSDDIEFADESTAGVDDDDLDAFLQQDFDQTDDSLGDEIDLDSEQSDTDLSGDILSADDIDDLFDNDADDSLDDTNEDMAALSEELAEDDFDIDSLIDEQNASADDNQDVDLDDIDDLLDAADEQPTAGNVEAELIDEDDFDIDSLIDDTQAEDDSDDIDSLIEETKNEQPAQQSNIDDLIDEDELDEDDLDASIDDTAEEVETNDLADEQDDDDTFDLDDIDSLIDDVAEQDAPADEPVVDELVDEQDDSDTLDIDDIDSLIDDVAEQEAPAEEPVVDELVDEQDDEDSLDSDDIDSLIDEGDLEESDSEDALEEDDIDSLLDEVEQAQPSSSEDELADSLDMGDLDSLLEEEDDEAVSDDELEQLIQETNELKQDTQAQIDDLSHDDAQSQEHDESLQESLEDLADADQAIDDLNVESVASDLVDIDEALNHEFNEDTDDLLDDEDSLDEFDDPSLKSVDELLSEIGEDEDDYIAAPDWSIDDEPQEDIEEVEIDLGDDPLADDQLTDEFDLGVEDEPLVQDTVTPSQELDEYPELELDDAGFESEDSIDEFQDDLSLQPSQAEQDLANSLAGGNELNQLEDDFDDELLLDNEFTEQDALESEDDLTESNDAVGTSAESELATAADNSDNLESEAEFELDLDLDDIELEHEDEADTIADIESEIVGSDDLTTLSDDEIDDDFMADLTQTDFDALLNELAEPDEADIADASEFDVDFNALLNEDLQIENDAQPEPEDNVSAAQEPESTGDEFVDIDSLLEQSDDEALDHEPYDEVDMDVGLSDFNELLAGDNPTDVDAESGGYSAKLDLARAYIEIDDFDAALQAIEDVIENGPEEVQEEALSLKAKIKE